MVADKVFSIRPGVDCLKVAASPEFGYNSFVINDDYPVLIHTGRAKFFDRTLALAEQVVDVSRLRYIAFSHFEADECGALPQWLARCPLAVPLVSAIGKASIEDLSPVAPRCMRDGEAIDLGIHCLKVLETPHCPHGWDACVFFESSEGILFSSDLGAQPGIDVDITDLDRSEEVVAFQRRFGFLSEGEDFIASLARIRMLPMNVLATQHGGILQGEAATKALSALERNARDSKNARRDRTVVTCGDF